METWYSFSWQNKLVEIQAIRTTDKTLVIEGYRPGKEERVLKHTGYRDYFPTKEEAIAHGRNQLEGRVDGNRETLLYSEKALTDFNQTYPKD